MRKEKLMPNQVNARTLFVGVGGTGSEIVRKVAENCREEETKNISFVCLDTNVNDLLTVKNSDANIHYIQTSTALTVGRYLEHDQNARDSWFPKNMVMYNKTVSEGAGQVRAISRLALNATIKTGKIKPLYEAIDELFLQDGRDLDQAFRVVIVSTASGGTGSGVVLPLGMFIRNYVIEKYPNTTPSVRGMILLPETLNSVITSTQERESQRRNAYATIKELNAFMMLGTGFCDPATDLKRYHSMSVEFTMPEGTTNSLALLPMDFCFLMDGQNTENQTMESFAQYKDQAAMSLYEQYIGPMQQNSASVEDNVVKEFVDDKTFGRNRFGGIGSSILRYPYKELADYVAYGWAIKSIGDENGAENWRQYDKAYDLKKAEAKQKELSKNEMPSRGEVYIDTLNSATNKFSRDIMSTYLVSEQNVDNKLSTFFEALSTYMHDAVLGASGDIYDSESVANLALTPEGRVPEKAKNTLSALRDYEENVNKYASKRAASAAEVIFPNEKDIKNETNPYTIEKLLKSISLEGETAHPVAARYILYKLQKMFFRAIAEAEAGLSTAKANLENYYSPQTKNPDVYDLKSTKKEEGSLDEVLLAAKGMLDDNAIQRLLKKYKRREVVDILEDYLPSYYNNVTDLMNFIAEKEAYERGRDFVNEAIDMYERFFDSFPDKVSGLQRERDNLVAALKFRKGDSVRNICSEEKIMEELEEYVFSGDFDESMLDSELNGRIYEAVKKNVVFERERDLIGVVGDDERIDIFDQILVEYFRQSVLDNCDKLDCNIVEAIALERVLQEKVNAKERDREEKKISFEQQERYVKKTFALAERLAAPWIEKPTFEEPREVRCVAYNRSLDEMRDFRMNTMFSGMEAVPCDSISRYEMHFYMAIYNLTPDKLSNFVPSKEKEITGGNASMYFTAYEKYSKLLGPDSTKNMMISTHIDKRWDSIAFMPEMDFEYMRERILRIHKAMIYALLYNLIERSYFSIGKTGRGYNLYQYKDSNDRKRDLAVSNGTRCDEFYEILDALYMDATIVEDIYENCKKYNADDEGRHTNYEKTVFARCVKEFRLPQMKLEGENCSLFMIPLEYSRSLPSVQHDDGEIAALVDAVIEVFRDEVKKAVNENKVNTKICEVLIDQVNALIHDTARKSNADDAYDDNTAIELIRDKVSAVINDEMDAGNAYEITSAWKSEFKTSVEEANITDPAVDSE